MIGHPFKSTTVDQVHELVVAPDQIPMNEDLWECVLPSDVLDPLELARLVREVNDLAGQIQLARYANSRRAVGTSLADVHHAGWGKRHGCILSFCFGFEKKSVLRHNSGVPKASHLEYYDNAPDIEKKLVHLINLIHRGQLENLAIVWTEKSKKLPKARLYGINSVDDLKDQLLGVNALERMLQERFALSFDGGKG